MREWEKGREGVAYGGRGKGTAVCERGGEVYAGMAGRVLGACPVTGNGRGWSGEGAEATEWATERCLWGYAIGSVCGLLGMWVQGLGSVREGECGKYDRVWGFGIAEGAEWSGVGNRLTVFFFFFNNYYIYIYIYFT
jgi:hypothetical protein